MRSSPTRTRRPGTTSTAMRALTPTSAPGASAADSTGASTSATWGTSSAAFSAAASAAGDLLITITVRPHELFRREGTSVLCEAPITFTQAVLGAELEIPTIDGKVKYTLPEGTQSGTTFRLKGKGIPSINGRGRGDQYVTVYIETPKNLNKEQKEALKKFAETMGESNYEEQKKFFKKFKK